MTPKSCLNCSQLGSLNIGKTGRRCYGIPAIPEQFPVVIKVEALAGFYCGSWLQKEVRPRGFAANTVPSVNTQPLDLVDRVIGCMEKSKTTSH